VEFRAGEQVDRYTLVERLGKGGQGTVWKVIDLLDRSLKAVKLIDLARLPPTAIDRARREANAVRELRDHPSIVPCHVLFDLPGEDLLGLVFDLVQGAPLSDVVRDPRMTPEHRIAVLRQIASALAHVHTRGLVHRDIKPPNVIVADAFWHAPNTPGSVKLVDFGIVAPANNSKRITVEGHAVGTTPYLAPELLLPSRWNSPADGFTQDIFAFGVLGFELLSDMHPTGLPILAQRNTFADAYRAADEGRLRWPTFGLNNPLAPVLFRCVVLDPNARIASGMELAVLLGVEAPRSIPRPPRISTPAMEPTTTPHALPTDAPANPRSSAHASTNAGNGIPRQTFRSTREDSAPPVPPVEKRTFTWFGAALTLLAAVAFVSWQLGRSASSTDGELPTIPLPKPSPRYDSNPKVDAPNAILPCCGKNGICKSGWPCTPGNCSAGIPDRWYRLRITGVAGRISSDWGHEDSFSDDYAGSHPSARICFQRTDQPQTMSCSPLKKVAQSNDGDRDNRAQVSTADIEKAGLDLWVEENGHKIIEGRTGIPLNGVFLVTALCDGIKLYIGSKDKSPLRVFAYLDPS
jgi:serine/threonine-protein kinase